MADVLVRRDVSAIAERCRGRAAELKEAGDTFGLSQAWELLAAAARELAPIPPRGHGDVQLELFHDVQDAPARWAPPWDRPIPGPLAIAGYVQPGTQLGLWE